MVFPKINHGFLSADQQLIKRRLIKVVLLPAGVWFPLCVQLLLRAQLLGISLSCMAPRGWVGLCQYSRRKLCLLTDNVESPPVFILLLFLFFLIKITSVVTSNRHTFLQPSGADKLYIYYTTE